MVYQGVFNYKVWKYTPCRDFLNLRIIKVCLVEIQYTLLTRTIHVSFKSVHNQKYTPCMDLMVLRSIKVCQVAGSKN